MKLVLIFTCTFLINITANVYSQNTHFTFSVEGKTIKEVFRLIEKESQFRFLYNDDFTDLNQSVTIDVKDKRVDEILNKMLNKSAITYRVLDNSLIVITPVELMVQQLTVTGTVTDETGAPMPGVNIVVKGTNTGVVSNVQGNYSITVPNGNAVLIFSFIGYITHEYSVENRTSIDVVLNEDTKQIEEVVVIGYGVQKKVNLTGAVTVADVEKIENRPITNTSQALQGLNGLYVNQSSGQPGKDVATIRIRGVGTLNSNDPLVLVDGIAYSLADINPNEIESISVLKDAASTAVYGSRAANGVILIKTKAGKRDEGYKVNYNIYFGMEQPTYLPDIEWNPITYMEHKNLALQNEGKAIEYPLASIEEYRNGIGTNPYLYPESNFFDLILHNGFMQEHNITVSGGGDKHNLALTLGYLDQEGILNHIKGNKYSMGLNAQIDINKYFTIGGKLSGVYRKYNEPWNGMSGYWQGVYRSLPIYPVRIEDGRWGNAWLRTAGHNVFMNPVERLEEGQNDFIQQRLLANIYANVKLPFNVTYRINMAANKYDALNDKFTPKVIQVNPKTMEEQLAQNTAIGYRRDDDELNLTIFQTVDWNASFAQKHNMSLLLGNSFEKFDKSFFTSQKQDALDNALTDMDIFLSNPLATGNSSESRLLSYFGRLNYNFDEKYLFEVNFRYDGSSRFAKEHRWGFFPSFSLGWRIDREGFMQQVDWITSLKPRFSWGSIGNQEIDLYRYVNTVTLGQNYSFGNTSMIGAAVTASTDPNVTWETTTMTNIGVDMAMFNGKLNATIDVYNKDTKDILRSVNLPTQVGNWTGPLTNIGEVNNKGIEILLNYRDAVGDLSYEAGGSFAYNKNEVTNLNGQEIKSGRYITAEGHPIDSYYIYEAEGIFQTDQEIAQHAFQNVATKKGFVKYKNQNPEVDQKIDADDRKIFHGVIPEVTYSFNLGVGYKGIDLMAFFQGVGKIYTYPQHNVSYPFYNGAGFTENWIADSWTETNTAAPLPILTTSTGNTLNFENSNFWLQNAAYLRLKNLQLSYTFPEHISKKIFIQRLKIFVNGQNLFTFSNMKMFDPEKEMKTDHIFQYPSVKIYSAGLNVTF